MNGRLPRRVLIACRFGAGLPYLRVSHFQIPSFVIDEPGNEHSIIQDILKLMHVIWKQQRDGKIRCKIIVDNHVGRRTTLFTSTTVFIIRE